MRLTQFIILSTSLILALGLTACDDNGNVAGPASAQASTPAAEEPTPAAPAERAPAAPKPTAEAAKKASPAPAATPAASANGEANVKAELAAPTPPPDPWNGQDCVVQEGSGPQLVICRDGDAARAYAEKNASPVPARPAPPGDLVDPAPKHAGLDIYLRILTKAAHKAKFTPILFHETPPFSDEQWQYFAENASAWKTAREFWKNPQKQYRSFKRFYRKLRKGKDKAKLRHILLRDGYLYTEDHKLARRYYKSVRLKHLFDEEFIYLQRGDEIFRLKRHRRRGYVYADGRREYRRAGILLFDRVATSPEAFTRTHHWDLKAVRHALGLHVIPVEESADAVVPFRGTFLSGAPVEGFLYHQGPKTAAVVAGITPKEFAALHAANLERMRARLAILDAAEAFANEWIRFDEPDIEFGQEDGVLKVAWEEAYKKGKDRYEYNGIEYRIFDGRGRPIPPQVCIDFPMESVERASGTWWNPKKKKRKRLKGTVDWRSYGDLSARSIQRVVRFGLNHPEIFDVYLVPKRKQVKFENEKRFYRNLVEFPVDFREADIIVIFGFREDERRHYHSFFVHDLDPMTGFPIMLSDNAGMAAIRVWHDVMKTAPLRYVYRRLRFKAEWLVEKGLGAKALAD